MNSSARRQAELHDQFAKQWRPLKTNIGIFDSMLSYVFKRESQISIFHKFVSEEYLKFANTMTSNCPIEVEHYKNFEAGVARQMQFGSYHIEPVHRTLSFWYLKYYQIYPICGHFKL